MEAMGIALVLVGYALFYTGASNLFTGGQGWGLLQSLLNKGEENQSGSIPGIDSSDPGKIGKKSLTQLTSFITGA